MIDGTRVQQELRQARQARMSAHAFARDIEALLDCIHESPVVWNRLQQGLRIPDRDLFTRA